MAKYVDAVVGWKAPVNMNGYLAQTGERSFVLLGFSRRRIATGKTFNDCTLNTVRDLLEEISADLG